MTVSPVCTGMVMAVGGVAAVAPAVVLAVNSDTDTDGSSELVETVQPETDPSQLVQLLSVIAVTSDEGTLKVASGSSVTVMAVARVVESSVKVYVIWVAPMADSVGTSSVDPFLVLPEKLYGLQLDAMVTTVALQLNLLDSVSQSVLLLLQSVLGLVSPSVSVSESAMAMVVPGMVVAGSVMSGIVVVAVVTKPLASAVGLLPSGSPLLSRMIVVVRATRRVCFSLRGPAVWTAGRGNTFIQTGLSGSLVMVVGSGVYGAVENALHVPNPVAVAESGIPDSGGYGP